MLYLNQVLPLSVSPSPALWTQLLTTLVVGLLTAFGFQLLLTNLGIVLGLSVVGKQFFQSKKHPQPIEDVESTPIASDQTDAIATKTSTPMGNTVGFGLLLTVNLVLFAACFLGTRFSQLNDPMRGTIAGITIWSAYWIVLTWVSTRTLNAVAGFVFDGATGGIRWVWGAIASLFRNDSAEPMSEAEMLTQMREEIQTALSSAEVQRILETQLQPILTASVDSQDQELVHPVNSIDQVEFWQPIKAYLTETSPKNLTAKRIYRKLEKQVHEVETGEPALELPSLEPAIVQGWLQQRDDLSEKKQQRILADLEKAWAKFEDNYPSDRDQDFDNGMNATTLAVAAGSYASKALLQKGLQSVLNQTVDYTLSQLKLSELFHQSKTSVTQGLGLALVALAEALPQKITSEALKDSIPATIAEIKPSLEQFVEDAQTQLTSLGQASLEQTKPLRDFAIQPFEKAQNQIQAQVDELKRQAFEQAEQAQKTALRGLLWLFAIAFTAAISSALAGVLATQTL